MLTKLSPEDRQLVKEQDQCPILGTRLGAMGLPVKLMLQEQPVFLCCKACITKAQTNPKATLEKVAERKSKAKAGSPPANSNMDPFVTFPRLLRSSRAVEERDHGFGKRRHEVDVVMSHARQDREAMVGHP